MLEATPVSNVYYGNIATVEAVRVDDVNVEPDRRPVAQSSFRGNRTMPAINEGRFSIHAWISMILKT